MAEPVGAGIAYLALRLFMGGDAGGIPPQMMGILFGGVAGIMVYISLDERFRQVEPMVKVMIACLGWLPACWSWLSACC